MQTALDFDGVSSQWLVELLYNNGLKRAHL